MKTFLIKNAYIPGAPQGDSRVLFNEKEIVAVGGAEISEAEEVIDARGQILLPGAIDAHVHFREPGLTHKADISTESRAALSGGVTTFFDMPNTVPQTTNRLRWEEKMRIAASSSAINYAFFVGATNDNFEELATLDFSKIPGIKVFLGSSTGNMLVNDKEALEKIFATIKVPIVVHAEDETVIGRCRKEAELRYGVYAPVKAHSEIRPAEACVKATVAALGMLRNHPEAHLHVAHLSTAAEVELIRQAKSEGMNVTCEVSPHHLLFTQNDYDRLGARIKMNPSVKRPEDREALRAGVENGIIDIIATDHAPHTLAEKEGGAFTAVSGAPMVQFSLPLMLDMFGAETALLAMCRRPAEIFGVERRGRIAPGFIPDMVLVEEMPDNTFAVADSDVLSKCGWTPLVGTVLRHRVSRIFLARPSAVSFSHV